MKVKIHCHQNEKIIIMYPVWWNIEEKSHYNGRSFSLYKAKEYEEKTMCMTALIDYIPRARHSAIIPIDSVYFVFINLLTQRRKCISRCIPLLWANCVVDERLWMWLFVDSHSPLRLTVCNKNSMMTTKHKMKN